MQVWMLPLFRTLYRSMMSSAVELWTLYTLVYIVILNFVQSIVLNGISAEINSPIGRNVAHCSANFNLSIGCIGVSKVRSRRCLDTCYNRLGFQSAIRANVLREVLMIREGLLDSSSDIFEGSELDEFVKLPASWFTFFFMLYILYKFHNKTKNKNRQLLTRYANNQVLFHNAEYGHLNGVLNTYV